MVNIGVVGLGRLGRKRVESIIAQVPQARIIAGADAFVTDELKSWMADKGIKRLYENYGDLAADPDIDAVLICTSTDAHCPIALEVLNRGKHVFVEKPLAEDLKNARIVCETVKKTGKKLQVGFNRRFDHNYRTLRELVEDGTIGQVYLLRIVARDVAVPPYDYIAHSGGMFMDYQIHDFDMVRYLTDSDVEEVFAWGDTLIDPKLKDYNDIDTGVITLKLKSGAYATIDASRHSAAHAIDRRAEISGLNGQASIGNDRPSNVVVCNRAGEIMQRPYETFSTRFTQSYINELISFVDAIEHDKPILSNEEDGYKAMQIALAANLSMKEGRPVKLSEVE